MKAVNPTEKGKKIRQSKNQSMARHTKTGEGRTELQKQILLFSIVSDSDSDSEEEEDEEEEEFG